MESNNKPTVPSIIKKVTIYLAILSNNNALSVLDIIIIVEKPTITNSKKQIIDNVSYVTLMFFFILSPILLYQNK